MILRIIQTCFIAPLIMGCGTSSSQVSPMNTIKTDANGVLQGWSDFALASILKNIHTIPKTKHFVPVAISSPATIPIFTAPLYRQSGKPTKYSLPIITCTQFTATTAMICLGDFRFMVKTLTDSHAKQLISNCFKYLCGSQTPRVATFDLNINLDNVIRTCGGIVSDISTANIIITRSTTVNLNELRSLVIENGRSLIVGAVQGEKQFINDFTNLYGVGFSNGETELLPGDPDAPSFQLSNDKPDISLHYYTHELTTLLSLYSIDPSKLDAIITALIYISSSIPRIPNEYVTRIYEAVFEYLEESQYTAGGKYCPTIEQSLLAFLLSELFPSTVPSLLARFPLNEYYPGPLEKSVQFQSYRVEPYGDSLWKTTGLYIPPGRVITVKMDIAKTGTTVFQIGSLPEVTHTVGPWNRWPRVLLTFTQHEEYTQIASPFGGIFYILTEENRELMIDYCSMYPHYIHGEPDVWTDTCDIDIPIAELETVRIIMTVPTVNLHCLEHREEFCDMIDSLIDTALNVVGATDVQLRAVFDSAVEEPMSGYPLIFPSSWIPEILFAEEPSNILFSFIALTALTTLPDNTFTEPQEFAMAIAAAYQAFMEVWPQITDPLIYCSFEFNTGTKTLIKYTHFIPNALKSMTDHLKLNNHLNGWQVFVTFLAKETGDNLTELNFD